MKKTGLILTMLCVWTTIGAQRINVVTPAEATNRILFAAEYLQKKLEPMGYQVVLTENGKKTRADQHIILLTTDLGETESYSVETKKNDFIVTGNDGSGVIYGCVDLIEQLKTQAWKEIKSFSSKPGMVMRGTCIGLQKTVYLPGHQVYEYPYTPGNFPWFYDKQHWTEYLDMLVENKMNSLYLWNGHPFASLVKLKDYPFALEVDEDTFKKNEEIFSFLTHEADKRGIWVIQMFYNIILSKPFADHYGLKTQDRHRPITPLIADYTRKSIAAFIENYPNVGLLVCLGEAMATIEDDVTWMK